MTSTHHRITSQRHKGKAKQLDPADVLAELNRLLVALLIPISLPDVSVVTSSLLLAVVESILERRFLALDDSTRTSRSPQSRSHCLRIILKVLNRYLDPLQDEWSSESVSLAKLVEGDTQEVVQLIDGLVKLSKHAAFPDQRRETAQNHQENRRKQQHELQLPTASGSNAARHRRIPLRRIPAGSSSTQSITSSSLASLAYEPSQAPHEGLFSLGGHRFDAFRVGSTVSSNSHLARSLSRSQQGDDHVPPTGQLSNPPTLRNLLGPLQAQMIGSKRPQSPRTAHRAMVNRLRNEGMDDEIRDQILNHDTDASLTTNIEEGEEKDSSEEESPYQYPKGSSMMTLDGIEPDDPFVSMETRRAMESQLIQNQTNATFDFTQWAVTGDESYCGSSQLDSNPPVQAQPKQYSTSQPHKKWSRSSSSAISSRSASSHRTHDQLSDHLTNVQYRQDSHSDAQTVLETSSNSSNRNDDRFHGFFSISTHGQPSFADEQIADETDLGFGKPTRILPSSINSIDYHLPTNPLAPSHIPLPPSPCPSVHEHRHPPNDHKVLFASQGSQLNLIVADVIKYERDKENDAQKLEHCDWSDVDKVSQHLHSISSSTLIHLHPAHQKSTSSTKMNLISKKLELLKLLNQAYNNNNNNPNNQTTIRLNDTLDQHQMTTEDTEDVYNERSHHDHQELEKIIEKETEQKNVRIRVARQPLDTSHLAVYGNALDDRSKEANNVNRFIVLNRSNLLQRPVSSSSRCTSQSSTRSVSSGADFHLEQKLNPTRPFDPDSPLLRGDSVLDDVI